MEPEVFAPIGQHWTAEQARREPAVTLVDEELFERVAPPLALDASIRMIDAGVWDRCLIAAHRHDLRLRITSFAVRLAEGEVSSSRLDWHVDRMGSIRGRGATECWDATDYTRANSFVAYSHFLADASEGTAAGDAATELVSDRMLELADGWHPNGVVQEAIRHALAGGCRTFRPENGRPVAFSARHIHRPGTASAAGWRLFVRVGAYRDVTSPYQDHLPTAIPVTREGASAFWLRGLDERTDSEPPAGGWSIPAPTSGEEMARFLAAYRRASSPLEGARFRAVLANRRARIL